MDDLLEWLQQIFANDLCNNSWEHEHGIMLTSIDNPGWLLEFDLQDTYIEDIPFEEVFIQKDDDEDDWYHCILENGVFRGGGGPKNLTNVFKVLRNWRLKAVQIDDHKNDLLEWLQQIFANDLCNNSWEHEHGITLTTVDNPGWSFEFDLRDTYFMDIPFEEVFVQKDDDNWYHCTLKKGIFHGWGGAKNLTNILETLRDWYLKAEQILDSRDDTRN
jgi:hypothetical protein